MTKKTFFVIAVIFVFSCIGCGKTDMEEDILGEWVAENGGVSFKFNEDHTMRMIIVNDDNVETHYWDWKVNKDNYLTLTAGEGIIIYYLWMPENKMELKFRESESKKFTLYKWE